MHVQVEDVLFAAGEALSFIWGEQTSFPFPRPQTTPANSGCAGTVWLVSLTMYCGRHPKILELLPQIQVCQSIMYINYLQRFLVYALILSKLQQCKICRSSYDGN
jgi:hypothetical protein